MDEPAAATDPAIDDLTLDERAALERAVDGPITPAMIADAVRGRTRAPLYTTQVPSPRMTLWARADLAFYRGQILALDTEIAALEGDHTLYSDRETERKGRHIGVLKRQRQQLLLHCRPYETIIARDQEQPETPSRVTSIDRPSGFPAARSED